jgi:hypothetical protein
MADSTLVGLNQINLPNIRAPMIGSNGLVTNEWQKWFNNVQVALNSYSNIVGWADAYPTDPAQGTYAVKNIIFNNAPTAGGKIGWVCITAGSPGAWKAWGLIDV